jgi:hypothetical protein
MTVKNIQADALKTSMSLQEFGQAMKQCNLDGVPEHKRSEAIFDHLMRVMADAVHDKQKAQEIHISRILKAKKNG